MLVNEFHETNDVEYEVKPGAYFVNNDRSDCDILVVSDGEGNLRLMNIDCSHLIYPATRGAADIEKFLRGHHYHPADAKIVKAK